MKVLIEVEGSPNACAAAVAMASAWDKGSMLAYVQQLRFFCEHSADRIDEDYDMPDLADLQDALKGVKCLERQLTLEVRRLLGEEPYPTPAAAAAAD